MVHVLSPRCNSKELPEKREMLDHLKSHSNLAKLFEPPKINKMRQTNKSAEVGVSPGKNNDTFSLPGKVLNLSMKLQVTFEVKNFLLTYCLYIRVFIKSILLNELCQIDNLKSKFWSKFLNVLVWKEGLLSEECWDPWWKQIGLPSGVIIFLQ